MSIDPVSPYRSASTDSNRIFSETPPAPPSIQAYKPEGVLERFLNSEKPAVLPPLSSHKIEPQYTEVAGVPLSDEEENESEDIKHNEDNENALEYVELEFVTEEDEADVFEDAEEGHYEDPDKLGFQKQASSSSEIDDLLDQIDSNLKGNELQNIEAPRVEIESYVKAPPISEGREVKKSRSLKDVISAIKKALGFDNSQSLYAFNEKAREIAALLNTKEAMITKLCIHAGNKVYVHGDEFRVSTKIKIMAHKMEELALGAALKKEYENIPMDRRMKTFAEYVDSQLQPTEDKVKALKNDPIIREKWSESLKGADAYISTFDEFALGLATVERQKELTQNLVAVTTEEFRDLAELAVRAKIVKV